MSFIAKNPLIIPEIDSPPSTPKLGTRGIFAGKDGWYEIDSDDNVKKLATEQYMEQTIVQDLTSPSSKKVPSAEAVAREISYKEDKSNKLTFANMNGDLGTLNVTDDQYLSALASQIMHDTLNQKINALGNEMPYLYATKEELDSVYAAVSKGEKHYGQAGVIPSDQSLFAFTKSGTSATLTGVNSSISGEIVIPYECTINGTAYPVTAIGQGAFMNQTEITSVIIPNTVTSVQTGAFQGCYRLESAILPDSLTSLGGYAFQGCTMLKSIVILEGVSTINSYTFDECITLLSITLPTTITKIDDNAIGLCPALSDVYYAGTKAQWSKIIIGENNNDYLFGSTVHCGHGIAKLSDIENIDSSGGGSIDTSNFLTPDNIRRWIDEDLATDPFNNGVPNVYALVDYVKGKTDSKRITDREDILPITSAPDGAWYVNNDNYPSMLYLDKCFEHFRTEIGSSGGSGSGSIDTSEFLKLSNIRRLIDEDMIPPNPYQDDSVPNSYAVAAYVKERTDGMRIKSGMTPLTQAYADGAGYVSDDYYPSMLYMALSLEQLKNEIIALLDGSSAPSVKKITIDLLASAWVEQSANMYSQVVYVLDVTDNSMIDLQPTPAQLAVFYEKDVTFVTENNSGVVTVYCIGQKPMNDYTIQATITEVER